MIAAAAAAAHKSAMDDADGAWSAYAKAKGLNHRPGRFGSFVDYIEPRVDGEVDDVSIAFELSSVGDGWGIRAVSVPVAPIAVVMDLRREGFMEKIAKVFGAQDIVLGDAAFDKTFMVRATHDAGARAVLSAPIRAQILEVGLTTLAYDDGSTKERGAVVVLGVSTLLTTTESLDRMLSLLVALAKATP